MREAGLLLPRADKSPVEPRCIHHMLALLEGRLGRGIKARFWEDRLRWPRNTSQCRRRLCRCAKSKRRCLRCTSDEGVALFPGASSRSRGQLRPPTMASLPPLQGDCSEHGTAVQAGSDAWLWRLCVARGQRWRGEQGHPYDPVTAANRQAKRTRHRGYARLAEPQAETLADTTPRYLAGQKTEHPGRWQRSKPFQKNRPHGGLL